MGSAAGFVVFVMAMAADGGASGVGAASPSSPVAAPADPAKQPPKKPLNLLAPIQVDPAPVVKPENYDLRPAGDGSGELVYGEAGFSARVARDGAVTFGPPKRDVLNLLAPFLPKAGPRNVPSLFTTINSLARKRDVPAADDTAQTEDRYLLIPNQTRYRPDPREACRGCVRPVDVMPVNMVGRWDVTEDLMRFSGQDPYRYQKARFLTGTRDRRVQMAARAHAENLKRALADLPATLEAIACDATRAPRERRAIIERLHAELDGASAESHAAAEAISRFLAARFDGAPEAGVGGCPAR